MIDKKEDEVAEETANASETTIEESGSEEEIKTSEDNPETSKAESKSEVKTEEIASDYLEDDSFKKRYADSVKGFQEYKTKRDSEQSREYQALKKKTDTLSKVITSLESLARVNPKIISEIEAARGSANMTDPGTASSEATGTLIQRQVNEALEPVKKVAQDLQNQDRKAKVKILAAFERKNPKLFSPKATKEEKTAIRRRIGKVANALVDTGMDFPEAVERAHYTINPKAAVKKGKDQAQLESFSEGQAGFTSQTSAKGKKAGKPKYSKAELAKAKKFGDKYYKSMIKETK